MKKGLFLTLITILTWSCENNDNPFLNLTPEEREIVEKAYSKTYEYPLGDNSDDKENRPDRIIERPMLGD